MKHILFDLDGTLTESGEGIMNSVKYTLEKYGAEIPEDTILRKFVGPPLTESFQTYCGFSKEQSEEAVYVYREYFTKKGIFENKVYPGIPMLLEHLKAQGKFLYLATSKPIVQARRVMEHFQLTPYFREMYGVREDGLHQTKADVIGQLLKEQSIKPEEVVMVGDRKYDVQGAGEWGIDCVGVLYGYGSRAELEEAGAAQIVESVTELEHIL